MDKGFGRKSEPCQLSKGTSPTKASKGFFLV